MTTMENIDWSINIVVHCTKAQVEVLFSVFAKMDSSGDWIVPDWLSVLWLVSRE